MDLDDVLLWPARLLGEPVVVLLDPGLYEAPGEDIDKLKIGNNT